MRIIPEERVQAHCGASLTQSSPEPSHNDKLPAQAEKKSQACGCGLCSQPPAEDTICRDVSWMCTDIQQVLAASRGVSLLTLYARQQTRLRGEKAGQTRLHQGTNWKLTKTRCLLVAKCFHLSPSLKDAFF